MKVLLVAIVGLMFSYNASAQSASQAPKKVYDAQRVAAMQKQIKANVSSFNALNKKIDATLEKSKSISASLNKEQRELKELNLDGNQQTELIEKTTQETNAVLSDIEAQIEQKASARRGFGKE